MTDEEMAKEYAIGRTYPKFETDYIANFVLHEVEGAYLAGLKAGRPKWHYPSKGELPKCDEETQLIFYVNCYYEVGGETLTRKRMVLGYYKKAFLRDDVKLFVEKSRGYEDEHLPQAVIAWKEIVPPKGSVINDYS